MNQEKGDLVSKKIWMRFVDRSEIIVKRVSRVEMGFVLGEYVSSGAPTRFRGKVKTI